MDGTSLALFRFAFGALLAQQTWADLRDGFVDAAYREPSFLFAYPGFEWVRPWPGVGLHVHAAIVAIAALGLALGALYRVSALVFAAGFAYLFLLDETQYLNHHYLIVLLGGLLVLVPAHRTLSVDARRSGADRPIPRGALWLLRAQMGLVYLYAGIAKLDADWLAGWPLRIWLAERSDLPLVGPLLELPATAVAMSWGGLLVDLLAWPLLSMKRTRGPMFAVLLAFHFVNAQIFSIGVFPWLSIAATTLFFAPEWPRRWLAIGRAATTETIASRFAPLWHGLGCLYLAVQLVVPLRHVAYPGSVSWTEEGHRFAWHMLLRHKDAEVVFILRHPRSDATWEVLPSSLLTESQEREMAARPYMIQQLARELRRRARREHGADVEVYARAWASLNERPWQLLIDPDVDLGREPDDPLGPARYIVPLGDGRPGQRTR